MSIVQSRAAKMPTAQCHPGFSGRSSSVIVTPPTALT